MRRIQLADHRGRDATVLLVPIKHHCPRRYQDMEGRSAANSRRVRSTRETSADTLLSHWPGLEQLDWALIDGNPEVDPEMTGRTIGA